MESASKSKAGVFNQMAANTSWLQYHEEDDMWTPLKKRATQSTIRWGKCEDVVNVSS